MSKKIFVLCLVALAMSSNAFASRARQLVMGTADPFGVIPAGTLFYDDNLNHIYNPSFANDFKNWASIERSNAYASRTGATFLTGTAEGGTVASMGGLNVGLYFDRGGATLGGTYPSAGTPVRPIDITLAGDAGLKWGLGFTHASAKAAGGESTFMQARLGAQVADLEPFFHFVISGKDTATGATTDTKNTDMTFGARYKYGEWVPFAAATMRKLTSTANVETKTNAYGLGLGRNNKVSDGVMMNYAVSFWRSGSGGRNILPIDLNLEAELAGWITGRAGLNYRLVDRTNNISNATATTGRMGATINAGKGIGFDFAFGSGFAGGSNGSVDAPNLDIGSGTFVAASAQYKW
jgi:hypothetical protein